MSLPGKENYVNLNKDLNCRILIKLINKIINPKLPIQNMP